MSVKRIAAWLAAVPLVFLAGACAGGTGTQEGSPSAPSSSSATTSPPASATETYSTEAGGGFSFSYPLTWRTSAPATGLVDVVVSAPSAEADGFVPNINVVIEPLRLDLGAERYLEASLSAIRATFNEFELIDRGRVTIDGEAAGWIEYRWVSDGQEIHQRQAYLTRGENGFVITFSATPESFDEHLGSQRLVESTFRLDI
jgi:hypothetical protein